MIYTIGYKKISLSEMLQIMELKSIDLMIDVRSWPYSRSPLKREYNRNRLQQTLNKRYAWLGDICGGLKGKAQESCIKKIMFLTTSPAERKILLMCMENHPCDCHRFYDISMRLLKRGLEVVHLFDGQEKTTTELKEACRDSKK